MANKKMTTVFNASAGVKFVGAISDGGDEYGSGEIVEGLVISMDDDGTLAIKVDDGTFHDVFCVYTVKANVVFGPGPV